MRKDPEERYQSMSDLVADLRHFKRRTDSGLVPPAMAQPRRSGSRMVVAVIVVLALAGGAYLWKQGVFGSADGSIGRANATEVARLAGVTTMITGELAKCAGAAAHLIRRGLQGVRARAGGPGPGRVSDGHRGLR